MGIRLLFCFVSVLLTIPTFFPSSNGHLLHRLRRSHPHRKPLLQSLSTGSSAAGPDVFFEVSKPVGQSSFACSVLVLQHAFAYTYDLPPAAANYTPPSHCSPPWNQVVLKWSGTCKGRQYDRIAAVWFGGVEVLRTCTAEPTSAGIYWEVRKDVTRFVSVFKEPQLVVLELANVVDSTYTGIFNINLTLEFFSSRHRESKNEDARHMSHVLNLGSGSGTQDIAKLGAYIPTDEGAILAASSDQNKDFEASLHSNSGSAAGSDANVLLLKGISEMDNTMRSHDIQHHGTRSSDNRSYIRDTLSMHSTSPSDLASSSPADLIIPISKEVGFSGGHWFDLTSENDTASASFSPPTNIYRAVFEVCVSFHSTDEFWYTNPPNDYLEANGLSGYPGNGPFREIQVFLDDMIVGAVWPFPVIFTGGINPLYWRPAAAIGAYNLPSYDIELTPFVGLLVDGKDHTITMRVTNADGSWPLDGNLHLWLDPYTSQTMGGLLTHDAPTAMLNTASDFEGLDGTFRTSAGREITFSGYIVSSFDTILASVSYRYAFNNVIVFQNSSSLQIVTQETQTRGEVTMRTPSKVVFAQEITSVYPFYLSSSDNLAANSIYTETCNLTHSFNQDIFTILSSTSTFESLRNSQAAEGRMTVVGSSVTAGVGALQQHYDFQSTQGCYNRFLHTRNYSTLYDVTSMSCEHYKDS